MCAVIAAALKKPIQSDYDCINALFVQSKIRGLHATGISYVNTNNELITISDSMPADVFIKNINFADCLDENGDLFLIGHCRYSTSDLEYNQPLSNGMFSVVHNGVITQETPDRWNELYGYKAETKNDSELLLGAPLPLEEYADASIAACELSVDKIITAYRNGKRPLYIAPVERGVMICSTDDIARRVGLPRAYNAKFNTYYTIRDFSVKEQPASVLSRDWQQI
jgi:glutamine phosphoribosylpyrophosphate amidotransferase